MSPAPRLTLGSVLKTGAVILLSCFIVGYIIFQARNFLNGPVITLTDTTSVVQHERVVPVRGTTRNIVKLTLNGREITTDKAGTFIEHVVLERGYTIMTLEAYDRFGRKTTVSREYVFVPTSSTSVLE
jgi:hypothetical protein